MRNKIDTDFSQIPDGLYFGDRSGTTSTAIVRFLRFYVEFDLRFIGPLRERSY